MTDANTTNDGQVPQTPATPPTPPGVPQINYTSGPAFTTTEGATPQNPGGSSAPGATPAAPAGAPATPPAAPVSAPGTPTAPYAPTSAPGTAPSYGNAAPQQPFAGAPAGSHVPPQGAPHAAQYPPYGGTAGMPSANPSNGSAVGALVCGILAIVLSGFPLVAIVLGIVAIVLAGQVAKTGFEDGKAKAGKVCGIVGIVFAIIWFLIGFIIGIGTLATLADEIEHGSPYDVPSTTTPEINNGTGIGSNTAVPDLSFDEAETNAVGALVDPTIDAIENPPAAYRAAWARNIDSDYELACGYSLTEMGKDPNAVIDWVLGGMTARPDGESWYAYTDGTGVIYLDVYTNDAYQLLNQTFNEIAALDNPTKEDCSAAFDHAFNDANANPKAYVSNYYAAIGVDKQPDGSYTLNQQSLETEMNYMFGNF